MDGRPGRGRPSFVSSGGTVNLDLVRLLVQGGIALAVLAGATWLALAHVIDGSAVTVIYAAAFGAVGAGAVGGIRTPSANGVTQTYTDQAGATVRTERGPSK